MKRLYQSPSVIIRLFLLALIMLFWPNETFASDIKADGLKDLAKRFVRVMDSQQEESLQPDVQSAKNEQKENRPLRWGVPDGELLLLQVEMGRYRLAETARAIKWQDDFYLSLEDYINALNFPITINAQQGTAEGWYINEAQIFKLDTNTGLVMTAERHDTLIEDDFLEREDDLYIRSATLEEWFGTEFEIQPRDLVLRLKTNKPLPFMEREQRRKRAERLQRPGQNNNYPLIEQKPAAFSLPTLDVQLDQSFIKRPGQSTDSTTRYSALGVNDLLYGRFRSYVSGNNKRDVQEARLRYSYEAEEGEGLFLPGLKVVELGDFSTPTLPFDRGGSLESGVRLTSLALGRTYLDNNIDIDGDAQPGWDIELYRNDVLLRFQTVGPDGRYDFDGIPLYAGDNTFRLVFYGPQGQRIEETRSHPVYGTAIEKEEFLYDFSVTRQNEVSYRHPEARYPDSGDMSLTGQFKYGVSKSTAISAGYIHRERNGRDEWMISAGPSFSFGNALFDLAFAQEDDDGAAAEMTGRYSLGQTSVRGEIQFNTNEFNADDNNADNVVQKASLDLTGRLPGDVGYSFDAGASLRDSGKKEWTVAGDLAGKWQSWSVSKGLRYSVDDQHASLDNRLTGLLSVSRPLPEGMYFRGRLNYRMSPDVDIDSLRLSLYQPLLSWIRAQYDVEHSALTDTSEVQAALNIIHDDFILTPRISYDTNDVITGYMGLRFGVARDPYSGQWALTRKSLATSGGVSARVYEDVNADHVFDHRIDRPLEGAQIYVARRPESAQTDRHGRAYIPDLQEGKKADILLAKDTLPIGGMQPVTPGYTIRPRAGDIAFIDFPVIPAYQIDGFVDRFDRERHQSPVRGMPMRLYHEDGTLVAETETAYDGYYSIMDVMPGRYYLSPAAEWAERRTLTGDLMRSLEITTADRRAESDGAIQHNFVLLPAHLEKEQQEQLTKAIRQQVPENAIMLSETPSRKNKIIMNLGTYRSQAMLVLQWMKLKKKYPELLKNITQRKSDKNDDKNTLIIGPLPSFDKGWALCQKIAPNHTKTCFPSLDNQS